MSRGMKAAFLCLGIVLVLGLYVQLIRGAIRNWRRT